ncbi:hypothetical protein [Tsukamurella soli]|uniref:hypothetical protein n=1 Tax=Tsukamurella soli TaxID=644556 RepID=UPI0031E4E676
MEIALLPIPDVVAGMMLWELDRAREVITAWADWTVTVPESVTSSLRLVRFPPLPELPDHLRGRELVVVDGAIVTDADDPVSAGRSDSGKAPSRIRDQSAQTRPTLVHGTVTAHIDSEIRR